MARWFLKMCTALLAVASVATAQAPSTDKSYQATQSPTPGEHAELVVMRTAGQKERTLRMVKPGPVQPDDLVEVKDITSGAVFSIPGAVFLRLPKLSTDTSNIVKQVPVPSKNTIEAEQEPAAVQPESKPIRTPRLPEALPQTRVSTPPSTPVIAATVTPTLRTESWRAAPVPSYTNEDKWKSATVPFTPQTRLQVLPAVGTPFEVTPQVSDTPSTTIRAQAPIDERGFVRITPQVVEERHSSLELELVAYNGDRKRTIQEMMQAETKDYIYELSTAVRPSQREYAASGLAACRFASRPEVKNVLARAAISDPAPSVRAHCVLLLSRLGYHDPDYLDYLKSCEKSDHPMLRVAANFALSGLSPKK